MPGRRVDSARVTGTVEACCPGLPGSTGRSGPTGPVSALHENVAKGTRMGSVIKKRRKRMSKKKHRKLLRKTRVQRRKLGK